MSESPSREQIETAVNCALSLVKNILTLRTRFSLIRSLASQGESFWKVIPGIWEEFKKIQQCETEFGQHYDLLAPWWHGVISPPKHLGVSSYLALSAKHAAWLLGVDNLATKPGYGLRSIVIMATCSNDPTRDLGLDPLVTEWKSRARHEHEIRTDGSFLEEALRSEGQGVLLNARSRKFRMVETFSDRVERAKVEIETQFQSIAGPKALERWSIPPGFPDPWFRGAAYTTKDRPHPIWDSSVGVLKYGGRTIVDYKKKQPPIVGPILDQFQKKDWPDALSNFEDSNSKKLTKKQLTDAMSNLRAKIKKQSNRSPTIRFVKNGTALGIRWEVVRKPVKSSPKDH
jgi:hypothetical protein